MLTQALLSKGPDGETMEINKNRNDRRRSNDCCPGFFSKSFVSTNGNYQLITDKKEEPKKATQGQTSQSKEKPKQVVQTSTSNELKNPTDDSGNYNPPTQVNLLPQQFLDSITLPTPPPPPSQHDHHDKDHHGDKDNSHQPDYSSQSSNTNDHHDHSSAPTHDASVDHSGADHGDSATAYHDMGSHDDRHHHSSSP